MFTHYFRFSFRDAVSRRRVPSLERLLARADSYTTVTDWRTDAFRLIAAENTSMPGVGAAAVYAELGAVSGAAVMVATPVHYLVEMSNVGWPSTVSCHCAKLRPTRWPLNSTGCGMTPGSACSPARALNYFA